jgi:hypothetical protein
MGVSLHRPAIARLVDETAGTGCSRLAVAVIGNISSCAIADAWTRGLTSSPSSLRSISKALSIASTLFTDIAVENMNGRA